MNLKKTHASRTISLLLLFCRKTFIFIFFYFKVQSAVIHLIRIITCTLFFTCVWFNCRPWLHRFMPNELCRNSYLKMPHWTQWHRFIVCSCTVCVWTQSIWSTLFTMTAVVWSLSVHHLDKKTSSSISLVKMAASISHILFRLLLCCDLQPGPLHLTWSLSLKSSNSLNFKNRILLSLWFFFFFWVLISPPPDINAWLQPTSFSH